MRASGTSPISVKIAILGIIAASAAFLLAGPTPAAEADSTYNATIDSKLCNGLPIGLMPDLDVQGDPLCVEDDTPGNPMTTTTVLCIEKANPNNPFPSTATDCVGGSLNFAPPYIITHVPPAASITPGCNMDTDVIPDGVLDDRDLDQDGTADGIACLPPGEKVGGLAALATLGLFNATCSNGLPVPFSLINVALPDDATDPRASSNIYTPWNEGTTNADKTGGRFSLGTNDTALPFNMADPDSAVFLNYPDWLLDLFDPDMVPLPVTDGGPREGRGSDPETGPAPNNVAFNGPLKPVLPVAVYGGMTTVTGTTDWTPLFFAVFAPGDLAAAYSPPHPFSQLDAGLGYSTFSILTDVTTVAAAPNPISDFCSPLLSMTMLLGTTVGNHPACAPNGCIRATNPSPAGTHFANTWALSYRDLDNDTYENNLDSCPYIANTDGDPRSTAGPDLDPSGFASGDMIDSACDPTPSGVGSNTNAGDHDGDFFANALDNCPLVANGRVVDNPAWDGQADSELVQTYAAAALDGGPKTDSIGDACDGAVDLNNNGNFTDPGDHPAAVTFLQNGLPTTVTMSPTVANGHFLIRGLVNPRCYGGTDADGDGYCEEDQDGGKDNPIGNPDNVYKHKAWSGAQMTVDTDGDGFSDWRETEMGTDPTKPCAADSTKNNENTDHWGFDFTDNGSAQLGDVLKYIPVFNEVADTAAKRRFDQNQDGFIALADVLKFIPVFNKSCADLGHPWVAQQ